MTTACGGEGPDRAAQRYRTSPQPCRISSAPGLPQNLTSTNEIATGNAIELNWEPNADGMAQRPSCSARGPESEFTQIGGTPNAGITTYLHSGLTEGDVRVLAIVASVPCRACRRTRRATPSGMAAIEIPPDHRQDDALCQWRRRLVEPHSYGWLRRTADWDCSVVQ
jgi:hypothetical protein